MDSSLKSEEKTFVDFPNTALYSPFCYLPQAVSIYILKKSNASIGYIFYVARLITFLTWLFSIFFAIRIIPIYKRLFAFLALLPMSICINTSMSADVMTNICSFLLTAYIFRCAFSKERFTSRDFIIIALLLILLALTKLVYTPIILLFLIIPRRKYSNTRSFWAQFFMLLIIGLASTAIWSKIITNLYIPYFKYNPRFINDMTDLYSGTDIRGQIKYILSHKLDFLAVIYHSLTIPFTMYFTGYIGTLGWLECFLPQWIYILSYPLIFFIAFFEKAGEDIEFRPFYKLILLCIFISTVVLLIFSQYISAEAIGDKYVPLCREGISYLFSLFYLCCFLTNGLTSRRL